LVLQEEIHTLPSYNTVESALYRHRRQSTPKLPQTRAEVTLENEWTETTDGRNFLAVNDGDEDKLLIFCTEEDLQHLATADKIFMDGTFKSCPGLWSQFYAIHAEIENNMFPLVYALMPNRRQQTYERLFTHVKQLVLDTTGQHLTPIAVQTDFEMPAMNALRECFDNVVIKGCFFHYAQAIWRKTQTLGLATLYMEDNVVKQWVQRAAALALLPMEAVQDTWLDAMNESPDLPNAEQFNDYVVSTWVDDEALFHFTTWNHHDTIQTTIWKAGIPKSTRS